MNQPTLFQHGSRIVVEPVDVFPGRDHDQSFATRCYCVRIVLGSLLEKLMRIRNLANHPQGIGLLQSLQGFPLG